MARIPSLLGALLPALLVAGTALAKETPWSRTEGLIAAFQKVKSAPEGAKLSEADRAANAATFRELDGFFDQERLTTEPLAPHREKLGPDQLVRFRKVFWQAIRIIVYPDSGAFFREAKWSLKAGKTGGDIDLDARLEKEDLETRVTFHWRDAGDRWLLADVSFDGASLVKDYQNQFGRIIKKDGVEGLLKRLEERYRKEVETRGALP